MVLRQVRKDARREADAVRAVQQERMGGDLHDDVGAAGVGHAPEQPLELERLRRCARGGELLVSDEVVDGADEADPGAEGALEHGLDEMGGGGFAVGARDTDDRETVRRAAIPDGGERGERRAAVGHEDIGDLLGRHVLADHGRGAAASGFADEIMAVGDVARDRHEQGAWHHLAGGVGESGDFRFRFGGAAERGEGGEQRGKMHGTPPDAWTVKVETAI